MPYQQPSRAPAPAHGPAPYGPELPDLTHLDAATAATACVLADPDATAAERIAAAAREETAFTAFARRPGGADLLKEGI